MFGNNNKVNTNHNVAPKNKDWVRLIPIRVLIGYKTSPISLRWNVVLCLKNIHLIILK